MQSLPHAQRIHRAIDIGDLIATSLPRAFCVAFGALWSWSRRHAVILEVIALAGFACRSSCGWWSRWSSAPLLMVGVAMQGAAHGARPPALRASATASMRPSAAVCRWTPCRTILMNIRRMRPRLSQWSDTGTTIVAAPLWPWGRRLTRSVPSSRQAGLGRSCGLASAGLPESPAYGRELRTPAAQGTALTTREPNARQPQPAAIRLQTAAGSPRAVAIGPPGRSTTLGPHHISFRQYHSDPGPSASISSHRNTPTHSSRSRA